ncbi:MAG: hypothetical protein IJK46_11470 [Prevotella sp.]|nr:hypothetical protein [Prevotella sp.]
MKRIEILFNRLNFGLFFPIWYVDCIFRNFITQEGIRIAKKTLSKEKFEKRNKDWENSQNILTDMQLVSNYNFIDLFFGFSVMGIMLVLYFTFQSSIDGFLLPYLSWENISVLLFVSIFIVAYVPVYYFFHRHDKREKYFIEFDKEPMKEKWKWSAISAAVYVGIWAIVIAVHHYHTK